MRHDSLDLKEIPEGAQAAGSGSTQDLGFDLIDGLPNISEHDAQIFF